MRTDRGSGSRLSGVVAVCVAGAAAVSLAAPGAGRFVFTDVTEGVGIRFRHENGAFGKKYLPETMASGVVVLDYDADGRQDIFFVNGTSWPGRPKSKTTSALYRNEGNGRFTDVTRAAGLGVEMYGVGGTAGDFDNDGHVDLYVSCVGPNHLFRNLGDGRFADVTTVARVGDPGFSAGTAFFDYDRDGLLDLYVTNYVTWTPQTDLFCTLDGRTKSYCTPESYKGQSGTLYHNLGAGRFEDVTTRAGLRNPSCKGLGVVILDIDGDDWPDVFEANDTQPNRLYRNNRNGSFSDVAMTAGVAFGETGMARAGMGVDAGDYAGSGRQGLVVGNFTSEMIALYHNEGNGQFVDEAPVSGVGKASILTLTFGTFFFDYDLDGALDVFAVAGHVADDIAAVQPRVSHAQKPHLFRNLGNRRFEDVAPRLGPAMAEARVGRGAAYLDFDGDGDQDVVLTTCGGPGALLRNDASGQANALRVKLVGRRSNRDGVGARVVATLGRGVRLTRTVQTGASYCSQSELPLTFGLGTASRVEGLEIRWPSGQLDRLGATAANQTVVIEERKGVVGVNPFAVRRP